MAKRKRVYETHEAFFEDAGVGWLHLTQYGEDIASITTEEMYQHFKSRMVEELQKERLPMRLAREEYW